MKFRTSFQVSRETREDGIAPEKQTTPFKMSSLRHKKSKPWLSDDETNWQNVNPQHPLEEQDTNTSSTTVRPATSRKQAMQDFLRSTSTHIKATGAKLPRSFPVRKSTRVVMHPQPSSKRNSQLRVSNRNSQQMRSFDIKDDVIDRLMGPEKPPMGRIQSDQFLSKQRVRASSRQTSSVQVGAGSPVSGRTMYHHAESENRVLSREEVEEMFVGAPYFNVEKEAGVEGRFRPQVIFRGGHVEESKRYGTDYTSLGHVSFEASTLGLHRTKETEVRERPLSILSVLEGTGERPGDTLLEVPSMLSANGLDAGTIGFEHFLQLPVADSTVVPDEPVFFEKRILLYSDPARLGLRELNMEILIDRLTELGGLHAAERNVELVSEPWSEEKIAEMGEDLFAKLVDGELGTTGAGTGDVTLVTQITALQRVLAERELWHDFSQVEWSIRVGQLLWSSDDVETTQLVEQRQPSERDVMLLQIMLAAELLVRLDATKRLGLARSDLKAISAAQSRKLQWDVVLAKAFLENLTVTANMRDPLNKANKRSSFFSAMSFMTAKETTEEAAESSVQPVLYPKNEALQLSGLLHFAETLQWPHAQDVRTQLEERLTKPKANPTSESKETTKRQSHAWAERPVSGVSLYATPLSSPGFQPTTPGAGNRLSYFGGGGGANHSPRARPGLSRMTTAQSMQLLATTFPPQDTDRDDGFEVGGWLSRAWLAGLVLPGEPAGHFLISTLLENSPRAIDVLGDAANLYGGFVYQGRGFWSKACVVGRVLAAVAGASECGGWVSVPCIESQTRLEDGWLDVDVKDISEFGEGGQSARIQETGKVATASDPLHGAESSSLQVGDFTTPLDGPPVMGNEVTSHGLSFAVSGVEEPPSNVARLTFSSPINAKLARLQVPLTHDVYFIASYPCHPRRKPTPTTSKTSSPLLPTPTTSAQTSSPNPTTEAQQTQTAGTTGTKEDEAPPADSTRADSTGDHSLATLSLLDIEKALPAPPAHSLHKAYRYRVLPVASLLSAPDTAVPREGDGEVLVLDCRGGGKAEDLEVLARAWCAKVGVHALVGREGRTCLGCCVREAGGLGVGVVIRT
ncbi:hypothetical protein LTR02_007437 [Friedmanniomyces endolithicus]|nr:hypothetical protein LTR59_014928 [Friedmanniomyces endolithicus]KAK0776327.1 hypothetical protein LTR38_015531 [Friedmanniomyces endolithicus]KAK0850833.1 hypothetical protein LTR03_004343 [Friedmanniomyces endolithicus]KAK0903753.1 hypothetical protein LTR02_007437 [Friedmanniomyces endolithicus]